MQLSFGNLMKNRTFPKKTLPVVYFASHFPSCSISIATTTADPGRRNTGIQKIHFPLPFSPDSSSCWEPHCYTAPGWQLSLALVCSSCQRCGGCWKGTQNSDTDKAPAKCSVCGVSHYSSRAGGRYPLLPMAPSSHHPPNVSHPSSLSLPSTRSRHQSPHTQKKMIATPKMGIFEVFHFPLKKGTQILFFSQLCL